MTQIPAGVTSRPRDGKPVGRWVAGVRRGRMADRVAHLVLVTPALVFYIPFTIIPIFGVFAFSLTSWTGLGLANIRWAGLNNYVELMHDEWFINALSVTFRFALLSVPLVMILSPMLAIALDRNTRFASLARTTALVPMAMSLVMVGVLVSFFASPTLGLPSIIMPRLGRSPEIMATANGAMAAIVLGHVWRELGLTVFLFLAGLQAIPQELYEAACIDGAGPWRRFWSVTFPLLRETTVVVLILSVIHTFQAFGLVFITTNGGPYHATEILSMYMYKQAFGAFKLGYGSSVAVTLFLIIAAITFVQLRITRAGTAQE